MFKICGKVLYRTAMALLKAFSRELSRPDSPLYATLKAPTAGLQPEFRNFCGALPVADEVIMRSAFKIPRFSRVELRKIQLKLEMDFKVSMD